MILNHLIEFITMLGYDRSELIVRDDWINVVCPKARTHHMSGRDSHPSSGFSINPTGKSLFKCFTCTQSAHDLMSFIMYKFVCDGVYPQELASFYHKHEILDEITDDPFRDSSDKSFKYDKWASFKPRSAYGIIPDTVLSVFPLIENGAGLTFTHILNYLINVRGLSHSALYRYKVRYNTQNNLIIFPYTDVVGNVVSLKARVASNDEKRIFHITDKHFSSQVSFPSVKDVGPSFGLGEVDSSKPILLVEGEIDLLKLVSLGFDNVVAIGSATPAKKQITVLPSSTIILGLDSDSAGKAGALSLARQMHGKLVYLVDWGLVGVKDPGEINNRDDVLFALNNKTIFKEKITRGTHKWQSQAGF